MIKKDKYLSYQYIVFTFLLLMMSSFLYSQDNAPSITAEGRQAFCVESSIKIVTDFTITDIDDTGIGLFFIQISSGYQVNFDVLELTGSHPSIVSNWDVVEGKLTLIAAGSSTEILFSDLENAVKDVVFKTTATDVVPEKSFSLSIGDANYLPATDHFYEFVSIPNITWSAAKVAAENRMYYGRQGYLATLTSLEEAQFAGEQASGTGWIGGSDEETEGVWKWVTGPEIGTIFWNGKVNGSTPNYANWNDNEPNDFGGNEDYAHITDPSIGIRGAWNDLPNEGGTNLYEPRGYIVEYGVPGDPSLNIVASTSIYIPQINNITEATLCESGSATIEATANEGVLLWYDAPVNGTLVHSGSSFTTPIINTSTVYYVTVSVNACTTLQRTVVNVVVNQRPTITNITDDLICSGSAILRASASEGSIYWYDSISSITPLFVGNNFQTPNLNSTTTYYIEAVISNCTSSQRSTVTAVVDNTIPEFDVSQEVVVLCSDIGSVNLETENAGGNYTYIWEKDRTVITGNSSSINVNSAGVYTVKAISEAGCESLEKTIRVRNSESATITREDVVIDDSGNNSILVTNLNLGIGEYEFAIDDEFGTYKDNGFFDNLLPGIHTLYIRDKGGCDITELKFSILKYLKFFTPNNDGENDVWKIEGFDKDFYTISNVYIYNRYGNLVFILNNENESWDGNYQGKKLPSNSYWFKTILTDVNGLSIEKIGNFSLLRN
ncbi:T9SS type B sorting domain-containing protein [Polaribacter sp. MSW13]|uniref:T9SS type B sorting domain-containing protein n=1 Tax=Polaribacter marinus TaxID=2916838 RepID=A0A9X1VMH8_9FLAO|nr:T9SS type B sorting domain-containing protein [Polaribacter marinus]MCI2229239.1 T9SS type B sorting domain-containing protein [Polaribacter marinus]